MLLILMGLRASGKSTLGPPLARALGLPFTDLDKIVAARLNAPTPGEAFARDAESFRTVESAMLRDLLASHAPGVIALGGGTPEAPGVAAMLTNARDTRLATIIYLRATPATLRKRIAASSVPRPTITGADPLAEIPALFARRDPVYSSLADAIIEVDDLTIDAGLARLLAAARVPRGSRLGG